MTLLLNLFTLSFSFILTAITIPPILRVARAKKLFEPFEKRKIHTETIPPLGGVAVFMGFILTIIISTQDYDFNILRYLVASVILIFFIGLMDDLINISAKKKFIVQLLAVILLFKYGNIQIDNFHGLFGVYEINNCVSFVITLFVMLTIINAFNLIDGIDGLASGLGILSSTLLGIWFLLSGYVECSLISFALAGSLCGFFLYNVFGRKNKLILGDNGSLMIGLIISVLVIKFNEFHIGYFLFWGTADSAPVFSLAIVSVPVIDTLRVITIRLINGKSPFVPDNNHIHHRLLVLYPKHLKVTLILLVSNIALIVIAIFLKYFLYNVTLQFITILLWGILFSLIPSEMIHINKNAKKYQEAHLNI